MAEMFVNEGQHFLIGSGTSWRHGCEGEKEEEAKKRKCTTFLSHISRPVSTVADEARCYFSSLSPSTPELMTGCPIILRQSQPQPHSRGGRDYSRHVVSAVTTILVGHVTSSPSLTPWVGATSRFRGQLTTLLHFVPSLKFHSLIALAIQRSKTSRFVFFFPNTSESIPYHKPTFAVVCPLPIFLHFSSHKSTSQSDTSIPVSVLTVTMLLELNMTDGEQCESVTILRQM
ncbi:hypothetical protein BLNAU_20108 [Blattamonas nauphoetae]|uniref:Uncharacterized protein n=1 Tax=Blattamonas nauphoetae TaxID=2049346 RepID=A0ABQ9WZQ6_9EUKA|nr:hypothetical protein BLNAU_20108 [Blattamonas nauphoetae]